MLKLAPGGDCADYLADHPDLLKSDLERLSLIEPPVQIDPVTAFKPEVMAARERAARKAENKKNTTGQTGASAAPATNSYSANSWPEPEPIEPQLLPVLPLPPDALPASLMGWADDVAYRMNCPIDYLAVAITIVCATVIGTRCGIRPKQFDDWLVVPNLWGAIVGQPAQLKTPSSSEAMKPLARLEEAAQKSYDEEMKAFGLETEVFNASSEALKADLRAMIKGKSKSGKTIEQLRDEITSLQEPQRPRLKRFKTNDATIEKMSELLQDNPDGLLLFRDELVGFMAAMDRDGREADRAYYLEAWNGTNAYTTDRIGRGTIHVPNLCVSLLGGIQPDVLMNYLYQCMRALNNDGFAQRLQLMVYPDENQGWTLHDRAPDQAACERAFRTIEKLATMDFTANGAIQEDGDRFPYFRFDSAGQTRFNDWLTNLELTKLRNNDDHTIFQQHFAKYRSLMPSLALICHLTDVADGNVAPGPVPEEAAKRAIAWCAYLESHARRIYGMVTDIERQAAAMLAEKIRNGAVPDGFTVRDIYRKNWRLLNDKDTVQAAVNELLEACWLKAEAVEASFRQRSTTLYHINPKVKPRKG